MTVKLLTPRELAAILSLPEPSVQRLAREGKIPSYRIGRLIRFDVGLVMQAIQRNEADE